MNQILEIERDYFEIEENKTIFKSLINEVKQAWATFCRVRAAYGFFWNFAGPISQLREKIEDRSVAAY